MTNTDWKIVCEDSAAKYQGTLYINPEKYTYLLDRNMKVYDFGIFKALSQAMGGYIFPNLITDFGNCIEQWRFEGVIAEETRHASELLMMEWASFIRIKVFNARDVYLYGGEYPTQPNVDTEYAIKADADRLLIDPDKGVPVKISKLQFSHSKNSPDIPWQMDVLVGMDFEMTKKT